VKSPVLSALLIQPQTNGKAHNKQLMLSNEIIDISEVKKIDTYPEITQNIKIQSVR
jgi:hypothetical protein